MSQEEKNKLRDKTWEEKKKLETIMRANANQHVP